MHIYTLVPTTFLSFLYARDMDFSATFFTQF